MNIQESNNLITSIQTMKKFIKTLAVITAFVTFSQNVSVAQTLNDAIKHLDAERYTAATAAFNKIAIADPSSENLFYKGYGLLKTPEGTSVENLKIAEEAFMAGNAASKRGDDMCEIGLGMVKLARKDVEGAKLVFEEVKKSSRMRNADVMYRIAEAYTMFPKLTDAAEAITNIDLALEKSKTKDNPEYYFIKSDAYLLKNEGGDAMNALVNAERIGTKLAKTYAKMSLIWLQGRNYKEASETIEKGIKADPTFAPIYKYESSFKQTMGKYGEAAIAATNYLDNSDGDCKAKLRTSKLYFIAKAYDKVKVLIKEIKLCSDDPYLIRMAGIMNFDENMPDEAIKNLTEFISKIPSDESPALDYGYIGRSYMIKPGEGDDRKMYDSLGILNIEKAIILGDTSFNYYQDLTSTFLKNRNYPKAAIFGEKNLKSMKKPTAADIATVGTYFMAAGNYAKADDYIDSALVLYKDVPWFDGMALSAKLKTYRYRTDSVYNANYSAAPAFEKFLNAVSTEYKEDPKNSANLKTAYVYLAGKEFQVNKNMEKAIAYLLQAQKVAPEDEEIKKQLEYIQGSAAATPPKPGSGK